MKNPYNMSNLAQMPGLPQQGSTVDPLISAGYSIIKGTPISEAMMQAAQMQQAQHQQQLSRFEAEQKQRKMMQDELMKQSLPQVLQNIDFSDPSKAFRELSSVIGPKEASVIVSQQLNSLSNTPDMLMQERDMKAQKEAEEASFGKEEKLRKQHANESAVFQTVADAYSNIKAITDLKDPSSADNIALTYAQMKLYDPGSVVREGEFATAKNAGGVEERLRSQYNDALEGKFLTPEKIQNIRKSADTIYATQLKTQQKRDTQFKTLATKYGVDPERSVLDFISEEKPADRNANNSNVSSNNSRLTPEQQIERQKLQNLAVKRNIRY